MEEMLRYSVVEAKNKREIVLLKGHPCAWGKCAFCDYILDNSVDENYMIEFNNDVLSSVTGMYGALEVINSGSVFELPKSTLERIKEIVKTKNIKRLFFESAWSYRDRLQEIRDYFNIPITFKCGIETFDNDFRNQILKKGIVFDNPKEVAEYFRSICLMVGIKGQTQKMIANDIDCLMKYFDYGCVNLYINNTTHIKADEDLILWFRENYSYLDLSPNIDVLWNNTDYGVGELL